MKFYFIFRYFYIKMLNNYNTHLVQTVYDYLLHYTCLFTGTTCISFPKQKVDDVWQTFWNNGFTQPSAIFEQINYQCEFGINDDFLVGDYFWWGWR